MHGIKHRTQRLHTNYSSIQALARQGDYDARIKNNLFEARVIAFETNPHRLVSRHAYKNALYATRRLIANTFILRKAATTQSHHTAVNNIDALLRNARQHAMVKSYNVSVAQDVFVLLSHYLGLTAVPEENTHYAFASPFTKHTSFVAEKLSPHKRRFSRTPSFQHKFPKKTTSMVCIDLDNHFQRKFPRNCASFSDLEAEHVDELQLYAT